MQSFNRHRECMPPFLQLLDLKWHAEYTRFLLAQLQFDSLKGKMTKASLKSTLKVLPTGPKAYDHAYKDAMQRIEEQVEDRRELAKQILLWISYAKTPLTMAQLQHALAVEVGKSDFDEDNITDVEDMLSVCAGLVTVDESGVARLVHYTAQEYFDRTKQDLFPSAESTITTVCAVYLLFEFETGPYEYLRTYPLYMYAAQNWGYHACAASASNAKRTDFSITRLRSRRRAKSRCIHGKG